MTSFQRIVKYLAIAFAVFLIVSIISGICGAIALLTGMTGRSTAGPMSSYQVSGDIESLDMEISAAALKIVSGDRFAVESNHKYLKVRLNEGKLKIDEEKVMFGASPEGVTVVLTVPEGFVFEDVDIETGAGKVEIDTLSANTLSMELGAGSTRIGCLNAATRGNVSTGAGMLVVEDGELNDLSMEIGTGKLELTGRLTGKSRLDFGLGEAELTLLGSREDYQIKFEKGIGSGTLDGNEMSGGSVYGGGKNRLDIDGGIGALRIHFRDGK